MDEPPASTVSAGRLTVRQVVGDVDPGMVAVLARRTISARYKQTLLGIGWAVLQPVAVVTIFVVFFGRVVGIDAGGATYQAFALSAVVPWQFAAAIVSDGGGALLADADLIRKVPVHRLTLVVGRSLSAVVQVGVGLVLLLVLLPAVGAVASAHLLWLPLLLVLVSLPALALAIALGSIAVWVRDVGFALPFLVQALLLASPVAYPVTGLDRSWQLVYALANPLVGPLEGFRLAYALGQPPRADLLLLSLLTSCLLLAAAVEVHRRLEPGFADVI